MPAIPQFFPGLPDYPAIVALRERRQWVAWRFEERNGRLTKPPVSPASGRGASHSNPVHWGSYDEALLRAQRDHLPGIGFVLDDRDGLTGADLDKCRDPGTGALEQWAADIVALAETYTEVSPSGTGLRIIWRGKISETVKCDPAHVELYRSLRYLTITGQHVQETPVDIREAPKTAAALWARIAEFRKHEPTGAKNAQVGLNGHAPALTDYRLINDRALADLGAWVPHVFPRARFQPATRAYRVSSRDLGRDLEEDLSLAPNGIVDFGVADLGDNRQGKRTPIDVMLEHGGCREPRDAAQWLAARLNLPDPFVVDPVAAASQQALARKSLQTTGGRAVSEAVGSVEEITPKPALDFGDLSDLAYPGGSPYAPAAMPGVLGVVAQHIIETALYPMPDFACLSALVFCSALFGRRWTEPVMAGGLNVYAIATAPTGWGKDHPLREPPNIAYRAAMMHLMGPNEFKSDSAMEKTLRKGPVRSCYMDEIGIVFQANASRNASGWERRVRKALLELYSASKGMWTGSQAAGDHTEKDKGSEPIHKPCLSLYGTSTPEELYKGLNEDNIRDGLFGRLIFAAPVEKPKRQRPGVGRHDELAALIGEIRNFTPDGIPPKQKELYHANLRSAVAMPFQLTVGLDGEARAALETIDDWQRDLTEKETELARVANRAAENTGKLATIRALSLDHTFPVVRLDDVQWGWTVVMCSLEVIADGIEKHMVGSEFEGLVKAIKRHLAEAGKDGLTLSKLNDARGVGKFRPQEREAVYRQLEKSGDLVMEKNGSRGFRIRWTGG